MLFPRLGWTTGGFGAFVVNELGRPETPSLEVEAVVDIVHERPCATARLFNTQS